LCDADVVIPIGCLRVLPSDRVPNANRTLYPAFSTSRRQHQAERGATASRGERASSAAVAEPEVAWLLGVQYTVQVLPGPGGSVMQVFAGQPAEVLEAGQRAAAKAWRFPVARRASLVVAAIEGDASQQTWQHIGRALAAATDVVAEGGAIALCCDLQDAPGPAVERLTQIEDRHAALRSIRKEHLADGVVANQLARAQEQASVYFLSRLDEELLEQLGIAAVADAAEVARLSRRHSSCIVLSNAQNAVAVADED
jgi:hypothetical protein